MPTTQRFGLHKFTGSEGALSDDGYAFSGRDRDTIDRLFEAFENHLHAGGTRLPDPTAAPVLELGTSGGALAGGVTYFYRVAYVDKHGLETAASPESGVVTPGQVQPPSAPVLSAQVGGALAEGAYYYALTSVAQGYETNFGPQAVITLLPDRGSVLLTMPSMPTGAEAMGIWRRGPNELGFTRIGETTAATFTDDGSVAADPCACEPGRQPGAENRTNSTNQVLVTCPDPALLASGLATRWRVYRSTISGVYGEKTLVAEIADPTQTTYLDRGTTLLVGRPNEVSQTLKPSARVNGAGGGAGGHFFLNDGSTQTWRVVADFDGVLETRLLDNAVLTAPEAVNLRASDGNVWRLTVSTEGALTTTLVGLDAAEDELLYEVGGGPHVPSPDPLETFQLAVTVEGALTTIGGQERPYGVVRGVGLRSLFVSETVPADARPGDVWIAGTTQPSPVIAIVSTTAPVDPAMNQLWFDANTDTLRRWNGAAWTP